MTGDEALKWAGHQLAFEAWLTELRTDPVGDEETTVERCVEATPAMATSASPRPLVARPSAA